ncbi:hypothetical protein MUK42_17306 [Musa troglodytarum]|uniref:Uncharacterized protein n=1 Tax=Musa troglodytarum TaxID=320322 RepID=A0A9E7GJZ3_9LILI|nr:hypothetical protein MUK42_17921 [Musa troglodytarum]URE13787.1 hypothetical protein MUK42_17306 [Musa troglodytarum]
MLLVACLFFICIKNGYLNKATRVTCSTANGMLEEMPMRCFSVGSFCL